MKISTKIILASLAIALASCSTGKKLLEQGNYYEAVTKSIDRLRSNPESSKARQTLKVAYPLAIDWYLDKVQNAQASNSEFKWGQAVSSYKMINAMYEQVQRSPGARKVITNPANYYQQLADARNKAAEERYLAGSQALGRNTRVDGKEAYFHFVKVQEYEYNYKDIAKKIDEARYMATLKVLVEQVPVPSRFYNVSGEFFHDKVAEFFQNLEQDEFVRFYSPQQAKQEKLQPDHLMLIQFDDFNVGQTHTVQRIEDIQSQDSVKIGEITLEDGTKKEILGVVRAKLTTIRKEVISNGIVSVEIVDGNNNSTLFRDDMGGEYIWYTEWGHFNGDDRALTSQQNRICRQNEGYPPDPQQMFVEFTRPIYDQLTSKVKRFYRNY